MNKITKIILLSISFCVISLSQVNFAVQLKRINCPYCSESTIEILDDEYGVCECSSCGGMLLVVNGRVELESGGSLSLRDLYDIDALIEAIENGEFDVEDIGEYNNYREYLEEDDEGEESYYEENSSYENYDANERLDSNNPSYKSALENTKKYLYANDFKYSEPESDEEVEALLDKKYKRNKKSTASIISSTSNIKKASTSEILIQKKIIPHVIKYFASVESEQYVPEVVFNGETFKLREVLPIDGFKFLGWSPDKEGKILFDAGSPLILYNFNKFSMPSAQIYNFYAIWEKINDED